MTPLLPFVVSRRSNQNKKSGVKAPHSKASKLRVVFDLLPVIGNHLLPFIKQRIVVEHAGETRKGMFGGPDFNSRNFRARAKAPLHRLLQMQQS